MKRYSLRTVLFLALCCDLGLFSKRLISPAANLVTDSLHIPGGVGTSFSLMFLVIAAMLVSQPGCAPPGACHSWAVPRNASQAAVPCRSGAARPEPPQSGAAHLQSAVPVPSARQLRAPLSGAYGSPPAQDAPWAAAASEAPSVRKALAKEVSEA